MKGKDKAYFNLKESAWFNLYAVLALIILTNFVSQSIDLQKE